MKGRARVAKYLYWFSQTDSCEKEWLLGLTLAMSLSSMWQWLWPFQWRKSDFEADKVARYRPRAGSEAWEEESHVEAMKEEDEEELNFTS